MKVSDKMVDIIILLLVFLDFQLFKMVLRARDLREVVILAFIDIIIWLLAVINIHK